jgi:hypothetical protein
MKYAEEVGVTKLRQPPVITAAAQISLRMAHSGIT